MRFSILFSLVAIAIETTAKVHHLLASSYRTKHIFALEYDSTTNSLRETNRIPAHAGHPQLALSHDKLTLYGAEKKGWSSYRIFSPRDLSYQQTLSLEGRCVNSEYGNGVTNLVVETKPPFNIFGAGRAPCGNVLQVGLDGRLENIIQNITFSPDSRIHGMALDSSNGFLFGADSNADRIWTHRVDPQSGMLSEARYIELSEDKTRPRKLAVHPNSKFLYVMHSRANKVAVYNIVRDQSGHSSITSTALSFSLVPAGVNGSSYRGQDLQVSPDRTVLYATTRYRVRKRRDDDENSEEEGDDMNDADDRAYHYDDENDERNRTSTSGGYFKTILRHVKRQWPWSSAPKVPPPPTMQPGFLTAIQLETQDGLGGRSAGYPLSVLLQVSTSTSGGMSNSMSPAPWDSEYVALADSEKGLIQVWRFEGVNQLPKGDGDRNSVQQPQSSLPKPMQPPSSVPGPLPPKSSLQPSSRSSWTPITSLPTSEISVWIPPPLKPSTPSSILSGTTSPKPTSNGKGPSLPGQGQWDVLDDGNSIGIVAQAPPKEPAPKPSSQASSQPPPIPDQKTSIPPQFTLSQSQPSAASSPNYGLKGAPPPNPLTNGVAWSNPWASGKPLSPSALIANNPSATMHEKSYELIPEFVAPPARRPVPNMAKPVNALGQDRDELIEVDESNQPIRTYRRQGQEYVVRANIVAEWKASPEVVGVGDPAASKDEDTDRPRGPDGRKLPRWGRGCCAFVLWLD